MKLSIKKLQELYPDGRLDRRGKNLVGKCPYCGEDSFGISLEENHLFGCYRKKRCGEVGNVFTLAKFLGKMSLLNIEGDVGLIEKLENKIIKQDDVFDLKLDNISMPVGWKRVYENDYMKSRGFLEYKLFPVGVTSVDPRMKKNYVITGIEDNGETKGYIARHILGKKEIDEENKKRKANGYHEILRYINSETDFSRLLFGYDFIVPGETKTVICVEGIFDCWNVSRLMNLYNQAEVKCVATFKCAISDIQIYKLLLKGIKTVILFYDSDVISSIKKSAAELQLYFRVLIAFNDIGDCDAGDIDDAGLHRVFSNLRSVSDFSSNKVVSTIN